MCHVLMHGGCSHFLFLERPQTQQVIAQVACARLLVTSRSQLLEPGSSSGAGATQQGADADADALAGVVVRPVGAISPAAAAGVVRELVQDVPEVQLTQVAAVCEYVPLVLRVVADALNCGRLTLTVRRVRLKQGGAVHRSMCEFCFRVYTVPEHCCLY